jgi:hypothetical protein
MGVRGKLILLSSTVIALGAASARNAEATQSGSMCSALCCYSYTECCGECVLRCDLVTNELCCPGGWERIGCS